MTPNCEVSIPQVAAAPIPFPIIVMIGAIVYPIPAFVNTICFIA